VRIVRRLGIVGRHGVVVTVEFRCISPVSTG
jgi:hypothetical protein